ncbi:PTS sugar transporter subunit IIA [Desulfovibrio sp. OttesenSCG-928-O18]|nr:PTS sugar transporter subunit IIA [Desulfovibrio sp. OttesenSCG-928-O18]
MQLSDYLYGECTVANLAARNKAAALAELAGAAAATGLDRETVEAVLLEREQMGSTAVGSGYAIPHGKIPGLEKMRLIFARSIEGIDFAAPDGKMCHFFFVVLAPEGAAGQHLGLLGAIARLARDATFTSRLRQAKTADELAAFLAAA